MARAGLERIRVSPTVPFWFASLLATANLISVLLFFPETLRKDIAHKAFNWLSSVTNIAKSWTIKNMRVLFAVMFLFSCGFGFFVSFFGVSEEDDDAPAR